MAQQPREGLREGQAGWDVAEGPLGDWGLGDPCPVQSPVPGTQQVMWDVWCWGVFPVPNTP